MSFCKCICLYMLYAQGIFVFGVWEAELLVRKEMSHTVNAEGFVYSEFCARNVMY
jgi:hypothetical protein